MNETNKNLTPVTRRETFLAKAAGQSVATPDPITREELFLNKIASRGGGTTEILEVSSLSELPEDAADGTQAVIPQGKLPSGGGGLPVVNITVDHLLSLEGAILTAEECAALDAAALLRMPIIAAITNPKTDINPYAFIAEFLSFVDSEGTVAFVSTNHLIQMAAPGTWMIVSLPTS